MVGQNRTEPDKVTEKQESNVKQKASLRSLRAAVLLVQHIKRELVYGPLRAAILLLNPVTCKKGPWFGSGTGWKDISALTGNS
ncbi:hypothetical protein GJ744_012059 [Endocarpon pusillum]|uniref:Uncharacterized protein n=1 Tax=Endocarpon pusillum TaxID=364733 RepID=A0A8H7AFM8_9EURO|nr:hypothetical protein GJ744_012059 [Endocarpon pusillum]